MSTEDEANLKLPQVDIGIWNVCIRKNLSVYTHSIHVIEKAYFTENKIGSITTATNQYGKNMYYTKYNSWGTIEVDENVQDINYTTLENINNYTGHTYDYVLGKYYAKNRMYDPVNKRFTTIDPIKDGDNYYGYVGNNPVNLVDPLGLYSLGKLKNMRKSLKEITKFKGNIVTKSNSSANNTRKEIKTTINNPKSSETFSSKISRLKRLITDVKSPSVYKSIAIKAKSMVDRVLDSRLLDRYSGKSNDILLVSLSNTAGLSSVPGLSNNVNTKLGLKEIVSKLKGRNGGDKLSIYDLKNLIDGRSNWYPHREDALYRLDTTQGLFTINYSINKNSTQARVNFQEPHKTLTNTQAINVTYVGGNPYFSKTDLINYFENLDCFNYGTSSGLYPDLVTQKQLEEFFGKTDHFQKNAVTSYIKDALNRVLKKYKINTSDKISMFMATVAHESKTSLVEEGVGNTYLKDGVDYRGGGYTQLTGYNNYKAFAEQMLIENKVNLNSSGENPITSIGGGASYVAQNFAWESAGWHWTAPGNDLNTRIDNGATFKKVSQVLNGGAIYDKLPNGWVERQEFYNIAKTIF